MKKKFNKGYSLVELLIYVGILSMVTSVVVMMLFSFSKSYRSVSAMRLAENSAIYSMERMVRDTMSASSVDIANSVLGTSPGVLTLIETNGVVSTTTKFYVDSGVLKIDVNGVYLGPLTSSRSSVTNLVFRSMSNDISNAVKIDLSVRGVSGDAVKDKTYHTTVVLRGGN